MRAMAHHVTSFAKYAAALFRTGLTGFAPASVNRLSRSVLTPLHVVGSATPGVVPAAAMPRPA